MNLKVCFLFLPIEITLDTPSYHYLWVDFRDAFEIFDEDKNGEISIDELRKMLMSVGQKPTEHDLLRIFEAADKDSK